MIGAKIQSHLRLNFTSEYKRRAFGGKKKTPNTCISTREQMLSSFTMLCIHFKCAIICSGHIPSCSPLPQSSTGLRDFLEFSELPLKLIRAKYFSPWHKIEALLFSERYLPACVTLPTPVYLSYKWPSYEIVVFP